MIGRAERKMFLVVDIVRDREITKTEAAITRYQTQFSVRSEWRVNGAEEAL
jgi:hypothetical protein